MKKIAIGVGIVLLIILIWWNNKHYPIFPPAPPTSKVFSAPVTVITPKMSHLRLPRPDVCADTNEAIRANHRSRRMSHVDDGALPSVSQPWLHGDAGEITDRENASVALETVVWYNIG